MKHLQTVGGIAALCLSALFVSLLVIAVVLTGQGYGPHMLDDPTVGIRFLATSWLPVVISLLYIGTALVFVPLTLALQQRFRGIAPALMQLAVAASLIASSAWLAYGMINIVGTHTIVDTYQHDPALGGAVYLALRFVANGMNAGAILAAGWAISLASWVAVRAFGLPKLLSRLMLLAGISMILSFALLPVGLLGVLLAPIWNAWLGFVLLRDHTFVTDTAPWAGVAGA